MAQFVLLEHNHPELHWDFMVEQDGVLKTWRLAEQPQVANAQIRATQLPDHRLAYLDYEGPVSGNRGEVKRIDRGTFDRLDDSVTNVRHPTDQQTIGLQLEGRHLVGVIRLEQIADSDWTLDWAPTY